MNEVGKLGENIDTSKLLGEEHFLRIHKEAVDVSNSFITSVKPCPTFILLGHHTLNEYMMLDVSSMTDSDQIGVIVTGILHKTPQNISDAMGLIPDIACYAQPRAVDHSGEDIGGVVFSVYTKDAHGMSFSPIENRDGLNRVFPHPITFDFKRSEDGEIIPFNSLESKKN